jgi:hypothetical protein
MTERVLEREFIRLAQYLGWPHASSHLGSAYARLHADTMPAETALDRLLGGVASRLPGGTALADAYARRCAPYGLFRRKLVLTLAILESAAESHAVFDAARPGTVVATWFALGWAGVRWVVISVLALVLIGPLHLLFGRGERG